MRAEPSRAVIAMLAAIVLALAWAGIASSPAGASVAAAPCPSVVAYPPTMPPAGCGVNPASATTAALGGVSGHSALPKTGLDSLGLVIVAAVLAIGAGALVRHAAQVRRRASANAAAAG